MGGRSVTMTSRYQYDPEIADETKRVLRLALAVGGARIRQATLPEDFGGVDLHYMINERVPVQIRSRFNRPAYAADRDVTLRTTEPGMMARGTYAPLMLFLWFQGRHVAAGKLVDVYRMHQRVSPPLHERPSFPNGDGTRWLAVDVPELHETGALLRLGDGNAWTAARLGGNRDTQRIIDSWGAAS
jgi:hypothetical protein